MIDLSIALKAEVLKLKRTLAFWLVFLAPAVILLLQLAMYFDHAEFYLKDESNPWMNFNQTMLVYWSFMMLPLFVTLETALVSNLEHSQHNWKLLYVQPIQRWVIYMAKQLINLALIAISMLILIGLMFAGGLLLYSIFPQYNFNQPFPWLWTLKLSAMVFVSTWLIISVHMWISARWPSFIAACAAGISATVIAVFAFGSDYAGIYPWTIPGIVAMDTLAGPELATTLAIGIAGGLLAAVLGGWDITRQEVL